MGSCIKGLQNIYLPDARQIIKDPSNAEKTVSREDSVTALIAKRFCFVVHHEKRF